jgi:steroid 5-alpha reductase family enzyme
MKFDTTINIGNVISFVALIITILIAYNGIVSRMINMENKVDLMWSKFAIELRKE